MLRKCPYRTGKNPNNLQSEITTVLQKHGTDGTYSYMKGIEALAPPKYTN